MLSPIDLDYNSDLMAGEVGEVGTDRCLTSKVMLLKRRLPQMLPELLFGLRRVAAQCSSARHALVDGTLRTMWHPPPTPDPSPPQAGGGEKLGAL
jgi:hypothetical protein